MRRREIILLCVIRLDGQGLTKGNITGASLELKAVNKALLNDSGTLYGLGQRISQIAQNSSASIDSYTK